MKVLAILLSLLSANLSADVISVAVASNFAEPAQRIADEFKIASGHEVILTKGSSGLLYAQIVNGAPFDVFLSADVTKPEKLLNDGFAVNSAPYAFGRLVLWTSKSGMVLDTDTLKTDFRKLAIANPKIAPYGNAAIEVIGALGLSEALKSKIVMGENITQAYQFVESGHADLGFVALSQVMRDGQLERGSAWIVPANLHQPIAQHMAQLNTNAATVAFWDFMQSKFARDLITSYGYELPK